MTSGTYSLIEIDNISEEDSQRRLNAMTGGEDVSTSRLHKALRAGEEQQEAYRDQT